MSNEKKYKFYIKNLRKGLKLIDKVNKSKYGLSRGANYSHLYDDMILELNNYLLALKLFKRRVK